MRTTMLAIAVLLASLLPATAAAQFGARAGASIELNLPVVLPQLVVVAPGVQVVPECDHEVFFVNGVYWARHGDGWYRSRSHRGGWMLVPSHGVPARLVRFEPGKYKRWKAVKHDNGVRDHGRGEGRKGGGGHGKGGKHGKH